MHKLKSTDCAIKAETVDLRSDVLWNCKWNGIYFLLLLICLGAKMLNVLTGSQCPLLLLASIKEMGI